MIALNIADKQQYGEMGLIYIKPKSIIAIKSDGERGTIVHYRSGQWVTVAQSIGTVLRLIQTGEE